MNETQKPFACTADGCGMSFTNEDHLNVHTKKHAMVLQLSLGTKAASFVADQTPTPTRLIRNCDEVGLFDDLHLQHVVNPFDETFRRAVESKSTATTPNLQNNVDGHHNDQHNMLLNDVLKCTAAAEESLHTPHVLPYYDDCRYHSMAAVSDATTSVRPDDVCFSRSGDNVLDASGSSTTPATVTKKIFDVACRKRKLLKLTNKSALVLLKSHTPAQQLAEKVNIPVIMLATNALRTNLVNNVPKTILDNQKPLPKRVEETKAAAEPAKSVRQKLKESILRSSQESNKHIADPALVGNIVRPCVAKSNSIHSARKSESTGAPKLSCLNKNGDQTRKTATTVNDSKHKLFERNREASKRYRNKMKTWHDETFKKNNQLVEENRRLTTELAQLKIYMLAHQDCSVTRAMAQGKNIPVGLPTVMIKNGSARPTTNGRSRSPVKIAPALSVPVITDVTSNPLYYIVNKQPVKLEPTL